ncbi:MAG: AraC family transcriptional regulator [Myxococcales bacterium]|nr:AraC family transcriptional regulator [Myxococcales bacterium]MCB9641804.1 AraC family transcriptional regulator [Myxococcales bacterium]
MSKQQTFAIDNTWRLVLKELGFDPGELLRRASLPEDLFSREGVRLDILSYYRLLESLGEMSGDPMLPLKIGERLSVEHFNPTIFAALCSPDLNRAAERLSHYKKLIAPMELHVEQGEDTTHITYEYPALAPDPPLALVLIELLFIVRLARIATREDICPLEVISSYRFPCSEAYEAFFGAPIRWGETHTVVFSAQDARRPFLTSNQKMWEFFQPEMRRRLSELTSDATTIERVKSVLLEMLPSGRASMGQVAKALALSTRTLQRRLKEEDTSFQAVLNESREQLARHYLQHSALSSAEISILLGFNETSSFFRAFHAWTGQSPERVRASYQQPD